MNFARTASLALLVALVAVQGCTRGAAMLELNETSAGHPVKTQIGQRLRITLPENPTTGYRWQIAGDCSQILSQLDDQATPASSGLPGAPGERAWTFAAKSEGHCELRFESARSWEKSATGKTLSFPVTVAKPA